MCVHTKCSKTSYEAELPPPLWLAALTFTCWPGCLLERDAGQVPAPPGAHTVSFLQVTALPTQTVSSWVGGTDCIWWLSPAFSVKEKWGELQGKRR